MSSASQRARDAGTGGGRPAVRSAQPKDEGMGRQGAHVIEMQRRRLLSAMMEVLVEQGYEGATVGRVCKRAGVSRRTFYDLYDDREGCLLDAFEVALARITAKVAPAFSYEAATGRRPAAHRTQAWRERVRAALAVLLERFDAEPALAWLCLVETLKGGPPVLERRRAVSDALARAIDEGRREAKSADPPPLTAESLVGGAVSVIHARLSQYLPAGTTELRALRVAKSGSQETSLLVELLNPLTSMIVLPYLGPAAARKELDRPLPAPSHAVSDANGDTPTPVADPFRGLPIRITFRTVRVLSTIGVRPDASNREIGYDAGVADQGQMSKLLARLEKAGLIENHGEGQIRGEANAWRLTSQGQGVLHAVGGDGGA